MIRSTIGLAVFFMGLSAFAEVIDSHVHFASPAIASEAEPAVDFMFLSPLMKEAGVDRVVALSAGYYQNSESAARTENDFVHAEVSKSGGRVIPFCGVNVAQDWAPAEVSRCGRDLRMSGLKIHLTSNRLSLLDASVRERVDRVFKAAAEWNMPVLVDFNKWDAGEFLKLAGLAFSNPRTKVIIAHALFLNYRDLGYLSAIYAEDRHGELPRNLYADISASVVFFADSPERETFAWYLRQFGLDRVFLGSDYFVFSLKESRAALRRYGFAESEIKAIEGGNFLRLMAETGHAPPPLR